MIGRSVLLDAIAMIAHVDGLGMNADDLVDDVTLMARAWPDETEFKHAVLAVCRAMDDLVAGRAEGAALKYELSEWRSFHFQHHRRQGARADTRIVYRRTGDGILVKGFGNRHEPQDIYRRMMAERMP